MASLRGRRSARGPRLPGGITAAGAQAPGAGALRRRAVVASLRALAIVVGSCSVVTASCVCRSSTSGGAQPGDAAAADAEHHRHNCTRNRSCATAQLSHRRGFREQPAELSAIASRGNTARSPREGRTEHAETHECTYCLHELIVAAVPVQAAKAEHTATLVRACAMAAIAGGQRFTSAVRDEGGVCGCRVDRKVNLAAVSDVALRVEHFGSAEGCLCAVGGCHIELQCAADVAGAVETVRTCYCGCVFRGGEATGGAKETLGRLPSLGGARLNPAGRS
jgi:hypothetical protein